MRLCATVYDTAESLAPGTGRTHSITLVDFLRIDEDHSAAYPAGALALCPSQKPVSLAEAADSELSDFASVVSRNREHQSALEHLYCGGVNLNAALLVSGNAVLVTYYCSVSEFANESWTGCL